MKKKMTNLKSRSASALHRYYFASRRPVNFVVMRVWETSMKLCSYAFCSLVLILFLSLACLVQASESPCDKIEKAVW